LKQSFKSVTRTTRFDPHHHNAHGRKWPALQSGWRYAGKTKRKVDAMNHFQIKPISDQQLRQIENGATSVYGNPVQKIVVDQSPGYPCRLSLKDAKVGEEVYLFSHRPFEGQNPYCEIGPVFVHAEATQARLAPNEIPDAIKCRPVIVRSYSADETLLSGDPADRENVEQVIEQCLDRDGVDFLHIRAALTGCYLCKVERG
jgi:hypothetical protein